MAAGGINAIVGSGSLITFPTLLAFGVPPVLANVTNNVGLVPGSASGAYGYRHELTGQWGRLLRLGIGSACGSAAGAILLLKLPASTFKVIVPALILLACVLVILQPRLNSWLAAHRDEGSQHGGPPLFAGVAASGVYGGYFGAAQGVLMIGLLGDLPGRAAAARQRAEERSHLRRQRGRGDRVHRAQPCRVAARGADRRRLHGRRPDRRAIRPRLPPMALRVLVVIIGVISAVRLIFF